MHVISALSSTAVLSDDTVRNYTRRHAPFFDAYQKDDVGSFESLSKYPESESETEAASDEKADVVDVSREISASRQCQDRTAADEDDEEASAGVVQRSLPLEQVLNEGAGWDHFAMTWFGNPIKFHNSATYHNYEDRDSLGLVAELRGCGYFSPSSLNIFVF